MSTTSAGTGDSPPRSTPRPCRRDGRSNRSVLEGRNDLSEAPSGHRAGAHTVVRVSRPSYRADHRGRRVEVRLDDVFDASVRARDLRARLFVDDAEVDAVRFDGRNTVLRSDGFEVRAHLTLIGSRAKTARLVEPDGSVTSLREVRPPEDSGDIAQDPSASRADSRSPDTAPVRLWSGPARAADRWCLVALGMVLVYGLVLRPFRPFLVGTPLVWAALTGSRTAMVFLGASTAAGRMELWWLGLVLATVSVVKFDPLFWWAGRLWGERVVMLVSGRSPRAQRLAGRLLGLAHRWHVLAILLTYIVPVVPSVMVYVAAGAAGLRLRVFLMATLVGAFLTRCLYLWLGYRLGREVIEVVDGVESRIDRYTLWISLALLAGSVMTSIWRARPSERRPDRTGPRAADVDGGVQARRREDNPVVVEGER
jgi:membrane protein DedA with SNARE-associated domain